jgi:hypothetical protein
MISLLRAVFDRKGVGLPYAAIFAIALAAGDAFAQPPIDPDAEIDELKRKIELTRKKIKETQSSMADDERSFKAADSLNLRTCQQLLDRRDTLQEQFRVATIRADSLSREIESIRRQCLNLQANQSLFRESMVGACERMLGLLNELPPVNIANHLSALQFLKSELTAQAVENTEAVERFWQIVFALSDMATSVDVFSAASPVASMSGDAFYIRLGLAYAGVVDEKGNAAYVWAPDSAQGARQWKPIENPEDIASMLKCAKIRQGNAVPEIVRLPFVSTLETRNALTVEALK